MNLGASKRKIEINNDYNVEEKTRLLPKKSQNKETQLQRHIIYRDSNYIPFTETRIIESSIFSSLWLQKFLYFNIYYSLMFFFTILTVYIYKIWSFDNLLFCILRIVLLLPWLILEISRLYGGYYGNIKETFPDLISFELLTLLDTGVLIALIIFPDPFPIEISLILLALIFNILELIIGIYAMSTLVRSQTALFYLRNPSQSSNIDQHIRMEKNIEMKARRERMREEEEKLRREEMAGLGEGYQPRGEERRINYKASDKYEQNNPNQIFF